MSGTGVARHGGVQDQRLPALGSCNDALIATDRISDKNAVDDRYRTAGVAHTAYTVSRKERAFDQNIGSAGCLHNIFFGVTGKSGIRDHHGSVVDINPVGAERIPTMFNIPMGSLLSAMANNDAERASLSSARGIGSAVGNMIPAMLMPVLIDSFGKTNPTGYAIGAIACAGVGLVMCLMHYKMTEERNIVETTAEQADNIKMTDILNVFKVNRPFQALCIHGLFICLMQYTGNTLSNYMYSEVLGDLKIATYATVASAPFMVLIFAFGSKLAKKFGLENMIRTCLLISSVMYISLFGLHAIMPVNPWVHVIWSGVAMGLASISIYMQWGLVGEAIDYNEMITGKRTEGSIYGTFNLARRVGQALGNSSAVLMLGWVGYNANLEVQTDFTIFGIKALCVLLPGIFVLGSWAAFQFLWNMSPETRAKIAEFKVSVTGKK